MRKDINQDKIDRLTKYLLGALGKYPDKIKVIEVILAMTAVIHNVYLINSEMCNKKENT